MLDTALEAKVLANKDESECFWPLIAVMWPVRDRYKLKNSDEIISRYNIIHYRRLDGLFQWVTVGTFEQNKLFINTDLVTRVALILDFREKKWNFFPSRPNMICLELMWRRKKTTQMGGIWGEVSSHHWFWSSWPPQSWDWWNFLVKGGESEYPNPQKHILKKNLNAKNGWKCKMNIDIFFS